MIEPAVSVVVPAYNAQRTLSATIASIQSQTFDDFEIVVVDDGSTDATVQVADSLGESRLRVISQSNRGHAAARNTGIAAARGRYIAFVDADDLWLPDKLARQLVEVSRNPRVRALQTGAIRVDDDLNVLWVEECTRSFDVLWDTLCFRNMPALMSTLLVERSLLDEVGGFDPSLIILQDWDLAIRLARTGNFHSLRDPLAAYRYHPASQQSGSVEIHIEPGLRLLAALFADPELPARVRSRKGEVYARFYAMLCGGAVKVGRVRYAAQWGLRALRSDPRIAGYIIGFPARRLRRRRLGPAGRRLAVPSAVSAANRGVETEPLRP